VRAENKGEELLYTVQCSGPCAIMNVDLSVNGDADLYASKQQDVSWTEGRFLVDEILCKSVSSDGNESCQMSNISEDKISILIRAYQAHDQGTLTLTGPNLVSAEIVVESSEVTEY